MALVSNSYTSGFMPLTSLVEAMVKLDRSAPPLLPRPGTISHCGAEALVAGIETMRLTSTGAPVAGSRRAATRWGRPPQAIDPASILDEPS